MRMRLALLAVAAFGINVLMHDEIDAGTTISTSPTAARSGLVRTHESASKLTLEQMRALLSANRDQEPANPPGQIRPEKSTSTSSSPIDQPWSNKLDLGAKRERQVTTINLSRAYPDQSMPSMKDQPPCPNIVVENGEKRYVGPVNTPDKSISGGGENISTAIPIDSIGAYITGSTSGYTDDYDESCPFSGSTSPDVVYSYSPPFDQQIVISLCFSDYDTKVYVYEDSASPGTPYACNDDYCGSDGYRSYINCLPVKYGHSYYIVIDGYGGAFGDYTLWMDSCSTDCVWSGCSPGSAPEAESCAYVSEDFFNGGCDVDPPAFTMLTSGQSVCGSTWSRSIADYDMDEDWYAIDVHAGDLVSLSLSGNFPFNLAVKKKPADCDSMISLGMGAQFPCRHMGFTDFVADADAEWVFQIKEAYHPQLLVCQDSPWEYELLVTVTPSSCEWVCDSEAYPEGEGCLEGTIDDYNGGCNSIPEVYSGILPGMPICGEAWYDYTLMYRDTDWYRLPYQLLEGDSVTWCVTANFPFAVYILDLRYGCSALGYPAFGSGEACDTTWLGLHIDTTGDYAFFVAPDFSSPELLCANGPWQYQAVLDRETSCIWEGCPFGVAVENESCDDVGPDITNGGCNSDPVVYSPISSGEGVCGNAFFLPDYRDTDWYLYNASPGETLSWCVRAEFAPMLAIVDLTGGCTPVVVTAFEIGTACEWITAEYTTPSGGQFALFVSPDWSNAQLPCINGPWEYVAYLNPGPECPAPVCDLGAVHEPEPCIEGVDIVDGGCNYQPIKYVPLSLGDEVCGEAFYDGLLRDTDWYLALLADGDSVTWRVSANFACDIIIADNRNGCPVDAGSEILGIVQVEACDTGYVGVRIPGGGEYVFFVAPSFATPLFCHHGPWTYTASLLPPCACDCAHDPECDGVTNIFDVTHAVNVAFRNTPPLVDPNASCPWDMTDVDCDGVTNIFDVTHLVNVAFRNADPAVEYCNPCAAPLPAAQR